MLLIIQFDSLLILYLQCLFASAYKNSFVTQPIVPNVVGLKPHVQKEFSNYEPRRRRIASEVSEPSSVEGLYSVTRLLKRQTKLKATRLLSTDQHSQFRPPYFKKEEWEKQQKQAAEQQFKDTNHLTSLNKTKFPFLSPDFWNPKTSIVHNPSHVLRKKKLTIIERENEYIDYMYGPEYRKQIFKENNLPQTLANILSNNPLSDLYTAKTNDTVINNQLLQNYLNCNNKNYNNMNKLFSDQSQLINYTRYLEVVDQFNENSCLNSPQTHELSVYFQTNETEMSRVSDVLLLKHYLMPEIYHYCGYSAIDVETIQVQQTLVDAIQTLNFKLFLQHTSLAQGKQKTNILQRMKDVPGLPHPLHVAAEVLGDVGLFLMERIIDAGVHIDERNQGQTALLICSIKGKTNCAHRLVEKGANIHLVDKDGQTALHYAAKFTHLYIVRLLLIWGAYPQSKNAPRLGGATPLHLAVYKAHSQGLKVSKALIHHYADASALDANLVSPFEAAARMKNGDLAYFLINPVTIEGLSHYSRHTMAQSSHVLFSMMSYRFPENVVIKTIEIAVAHKDTELLCSTTDSDGRTALWWSCKIKYVQAANILLDFFLAARRHSFPGADLCNPHTVDSRGFSAIEIFLTSHRASLGDPWIAGLAKRLLGFRDSTGSTFLIQALRSEERTMRKSATVTFASTNVEKEIVFFPPSTMSMDNLYLTLPTLAGIPGAPQMTPFRVALRYRRRRAQRLVMKAMIVSLQSNINTYETLKQLWLGVLEAAALQEPSALTFAAKAYPYLIQDVLSLVSAGDVNAEQMVEPLVNILPPAFSFDTPGISPLENAVWFVMSPFSTSDLTLFNSLTARNRILGSDPQDCRAALLAVHQAGLYFSRFMKRIDLKNELMRKKNYILTKLFNSPILHIHENLIFVSGIIVQIQTIIIVGFLAWIFVITRLPPIFLNYHDPLTIVPHPSHLRTCLLEGLHSVIGWRAFTTPYWSDGAPKYSAALLCGFRCIIFIRLMCSSLFWKSPEFYWWPIILTFLIFIQSAMMSQEISPLANDMLHENLNVFQAFPNELFLEIQPPAMKLKSSFATTDNPNHPDNASHLHYLLNLLEWLGAHTQQPKLFNELKMKLEAKKLFPTVYKKLTHPIPQKKCIFSSLKRPFHGTWIPQYNYRRHVHPSFKVFKKNAYILNTPIRCLSICRQERHILKLIRLLRELVPQNDLPQHSKIKISPTESTEWKYIWDTPNAIQSYNWDNRIIALFSYLSQQQRVDVRYNKEDYYYERLVALILFPLLKKAHIESKDHVYKKENLLYTMHRLMIQTVSRQFKIPAIEYYYLNLFIFILSICSATLPHIGGVFLCNYISVYRNEELMENILHYPIKAIEFEAMLTLTLTLLLFSFFKSFFLVLAIIKQRRRLVDALKIVSPLELNRYVPLQLKHQDDSFLWEATDIWATIWRRALYRSDILWKPAEKLLNRLTVLGLILIAWLMKCTTTENEILRTRTGILTLSFSIAIMWLVTKCTSEAAAYNEAETQSYEWLSTLYASTRLDTTNHEVLQGQFAKLILIDSKKLRLLGFYISNVCYRLIQVAAIPTVLFLILSSIQLEAPSMYI